MKNSIMGDTLKLSTSKTITLLISMVSSMLLSRFRTLEEYGTYSQILMVVTISISLFTLGLPNSINFFLARIEDKGEKQKFVSNYYTLNTLLSILAGVVLAIFMPYIVKYFDNPLLETFAYACAILPWTRVIGGSVDHLLIVQQKTKLLLFYRITHSLFLLLAIILTQVLGWSFNGYVLIYVIVESIFSIIVYIIAKNEVGSLYINFNISLIKDILRFSIPLGMASLVGTISLELDKLMIGRLMDTESLAIYTNAGRELPLTIISSSLTAVLLPKIVRLVHADRLKEGIALWKDSITFSFYITSFSVCALLVFAPQVITVLYSSKYLDGTGVFRIYSLVLILRTTYFGMILNAMGKTRFIFYITLFSLLLNLCLNYLFFLIFGFIGPALATLVSMLISSVFYMFLNARITHVRIRDIISFGEIGKISMLNIILSIIVLFSYKVLNLGTSVQDIIKSIIIGIIWLLIYFLIVAKPFKSKLKILSI